MKRCIICREERSSFSDEHVIPKALGGFYHVHSVCKSCNSHLGAKVDSKLVNHKFAEFQRMSDGLKGRSGQLPNPFSGTYTQLSDEDKEDKPVKVRLDENGKFVPYLIPKISHTSEEDGTKIITVSIDASDDLDSILTKISKRLKIPVSQMLSSGEIRTVSEHAPIRGRLVIDIREFKIGLLKMAYEFAIDCLPDYYEDNMAKDISEILKDARYEEVEKYVNIGNGFDHSLFDLFSDYIDIENNRHYLVLVGSSVEGVLRCFVHLHGMFSIGVILSTTRQVGEFIVGINDIDKREFRKLRQGQIAEEVYGTPEIIFQYHFETYDEMLTFQRHELSKDFYFYTENNRHPAFDKFGNRKNGFVEDEVLKSGESLGAYEQMRGGGFSQTIALNENEDVYVKIMPSEMLIRVVAVRYEYSRRAKL